MKFAKDKDVEEAFKKIKVDIEKINNRLKSLEELKDTRVLESTRIKEEEPLEELEIIARKLTPKEKKIVEFLLQDQRKLSYKDLSISLEMNVNTIKKHINNICSKGFPLSFIIEGGIQKRYYIKENIKHLILNR